MRSASSTRYSTEGRAIRFALLALAIGALSMRSDAASPPAAQDSAQQPEHAIEGRVWRAGTHGPVEGAVVSLRSSDESVVLQTARTDAEGRFGFKDLPLGWYVLDAQLEGYHGPGRDGSGPRKAVQVSPPPLVDNVTLELTPGAEISGRVFNADGSPAGPMLALRAIGNERGSFSHTNERGEFRLSGLMAGDQIICAEFPLEAAKHSEPDDTPSTPCYLGFDKPGVGVRVSVRAGQQRSIDLRIAGPSPRPSFAVSVKVLTSVPEMSVSAVLVDRQTGEKAQFSEFAQSVGRLDLSRRMNFCCVPGGSYDLWVSGTLEHDEHIQVGHATIEVRENVRNVEVRLDAGVNLSGHLTWDGRKPTPEQVRTQGCLDFHANDVLGGFSFNVSPASSASRRVMTGDISNFVNPATAEFTVETVPAGTWYVDACGAAAYVADVRQAGRSVRDGLVIGRVAPSPIEVMLRTDGAMIAGTVQDSNGKPVSGASVLMVPKGARFDYQSMFRYSAAADNAGRFTMRFMAAPGTYRVYAWSTREAHGSVNLRTLLKNPGDLERYEKSAQTVNVAPGSPLSLRVTAIP